MATLSLGCMAINKGVAGVLMGSKGFQGRKDWMAARQRSA
jgi:hypothetical protein